MKHIIFFLLLALSVNNGFAQDKLTPQQILSRSLEAIGFNSSSNQVLKYSASKITEMDYQSDRTYPPYLAFTEQKEIWYDLSSNIEKSSVTSTYPLNGPNPAGNFIRSYNQAFMVRNDTSYFELSQGNGTDPYLNPVMVLQEWQKKGDLKMEKEQIFREYPRYVISRKNDEKKELLYVDKKTFFPVKTEFTQSHYLWGQVKVEYLYVTWFKAGEMVFPTSSYRIVDGHPLSHRIHASRSMVSQEEAPDIDLPQNYQPSSGNGNIFLLEERPDTIRVNDNTYLLKNRGYTEAVTLAGNTIYIFDATQGEQRAKYDHEWVKQLFPGDYDIAVVVTDLAWPHIGGVRYWVSQGATIISHKHSEAFLKNIVNRKWTLQPDELEEKRKEGNIPFKFTAVSSKTLFADGSIILAPIDGIGSEGSILAYDNRSRFLWPGDYIQQGEVARHYSKEVYQAVNHHSLNPSYFAAQHVDITDWKEIEELFSKEH